ncbi:MAG: 2,3-bisphosphoglycerate-dependent phosphoglycerate mutase [Gammaproteobacteria bacterium]|jgi:2,3-bisphosphoglycerate-dependent phosphoglycerate mutase|nr:2,3-bisphosphoglycerate-dependent phosphoglycerate mutase [Gammaproteobacteria bacterium]MBS65932.1 2,3-bisphosphoglycerate-dependent phosphoglycerate mutase [Gammaproteobacteria bacterium]|tara:strand:+ start:2145 stop:2753 length:609 start_codon:yes stop_codon:yes gene_type:complete
MKKSILVLVRHGQSEWNQKNLFTGWKDPKLTHQGINEAVEAGKSLKAEDMNFDIMFTSDLFRAQETGRLILKEMDQTDIPFVKHQSLNERNYGDLAGLNKDDARERWGEEQVHIWRRSFDIPPPGGESLKNTAERVLPYFESEIMPKIDEGLNVLIAAHGNSLRALVMQLENIDPEEIVKLEIATGDPLIYDCTHQTITRRN